MALPEWLSHDKKKCEFVIDTDKACSQFQGLLKLDDDDLDQYHVEVINHCVRREAKLQIGLAGCDPRKTETPKTLVLHFLRCDKWALKNFPKGRGVEAGAKDARQIYKGLRGVDPQ